MYRLHQVGVTTGLHGLAVILRLTISAQRDDGQVGLRRFLAHPASHLVPVHAGQAHIEQHHIGLELVQNLKRGRSIVGDPHLVIIASQYQGQTLGDIWMIFDDEEASRIRYPRRLENRRRQGRGRSR